MDSTCHYQLFTASCPGLVPFFCEYSSSLVRAHKLKLRVNFLQQCLKEQVMPRSILPKRVLQMSDRPFEEFHHIILKKHIELTKIEKEQAFFTTRQKKQVFLSVIPNEWQNRLFDYCYDKLRRSCNVLQNKLKRKLMNLIMHSEWSRNANSDFVVNLSDKELDSDTKCALGYGLSFTGLKHNINNVDVAKAFCNLEKYSDLPSDDLSICKGIVYASMSKESVPNCPQRFVKSIKSIKNDSDLHVTKADKSNAVVILNKVDYISKMNNLLNDESTYSKLRSNPLENVNANFNKKLKQLLKNDKQLIKKFSSLSPSLPYMYGLIKTHKDGNPPRPIISSTGSVTYKLSQWLVTMLSPLVGNISHSHIKNNEDLVDKLQHLDVDFDFRMVSFDVTSLFTKVPVDDLLDFLLPKLDDLDLPVSNSVFIELIKLCVKDCKFTFNGEYYSQKFGMAMGNPLSPVLSNLYMEFFEKNLLADILPCNVIWLRYVDDILCLWPCSEDVDSFLTHLNNLVPSIKFTLEVENDCKLPFLDCLIHRVDRTFLFDIYRKPTNVCSYIHFYSSHSDKVKLSVFSSMFLRALRICSPQFIDDEFRMIFDIGSRLKYPRPFLDKSLNLAKRTYYKTESGSSFELKNLLVLPFSDKFTQVPELLKIFNVNVAFSNSGTIKDILIKNSPDQVDGCVYKIPCTECNKCYIGQTGKNLTMRVKQHKYSVRTGQESNALFIHQRDMNHCIDWSHASSIFPCNDIVKRNIIESSMIKHSINDLINVSTGMYKLDNFISNRIVRQICRN